MRTTPLTAALAALLAGLPAAALAAPAAEPGFDACEVFTQAMAKAALGTAAEPEPINPKVRRPKVIPTCTYHGSKDGKPVSASVTFRFARSDAEAGHAFGEEKLKFQSKPMLIGGASAFWSAKLGNLQMLKGRTWVVITVGGAKPADREDDDARKVADALEKKL